MPANFIVAKLSFSVLGRYSRWRGAEQRVKIVPISLSLYRYVPRSQKIQTKTRKREKARKARRRIRTRPSLCRDSTRLQRLQHLLSTPSSTYLVSLISHFTRFYFAISLLLPSALVEQHSPSPPELRLPN